AIVIYGVFRGPWGGPNFDAIFTRFFGNTCFGGGTVRSDADAVQRKPSSTCGVPKECGVLVGDGTCPCRCSAKAADALVFLAHVNVYRCGTSEGAQKSDGTRKKRKTFH
ncbi:MAG: hypothetical protein IJ905_00555, partial [Fibrobacter sp.]|nr:hypothetical protein [Fibrobacter sp.]